MSSRIETRYRICPRCGAEVSEASAVGHEREDVLKCYMCEHRFERKAARGTTHPA